MPFDAKLMLITGLTFLKAETTPAIALTDPEGWGKFVLDLRGTAAKGMSAVLISTMTPSNQYGMSMNAVIEASDEVDRNYEEIAKFPVLHHYTREMACVGVAGFVPTDIGKTIAGGGAGTDSGTLLSYDSALEVASGEGNIVVEMDAVDDVFDQLAETLTVAEGTGVCTHALAAWVPIQDCPGIYVVKFATTKRYVRFHSTIVGNFHKCLVYLTPYPFDTL